MWKGVLRLGKLSVATTLHAAVEDRAVHFHLLHDDDQVRVRQRLVNPATGETQSDGDVHRGYEVERGTYVLFTDAELSSLEPEASRDIRLHSFVPQKALGAVWYERPYYLAPDGQADAYFALAEALKNRGLAGIAHWVMRKKQYHGAVLPHGDHLAMVTLRPLDEVLKPPKVEPLHRAADARELSMAEQLVSALSGKFDPTEFSDEHRARVSALIEAKARGKKPKAAKPSRRPAPKSLSAALAASLKTIHKEQKSA